MTSMKRCIITFLFLFAFTSVASAAEKTQIVIVVGPSKHPAGTHEVAAGARLIQHCLEKAENLKDVTATVVYEWPRDKAIRDRASTIVFIGDTFPANRFPNPKQNLADLTEMMDRGCGIVCIHYATGLLGEDVTKTGDHPLLGWMGGYFANRSCPHHESIAKIFPKATITPASPNHPTSRGWKEFTLKDEPYINNYFGGEGNKLGKNVTPLATSMLPPESPKNETVAWCIERKDTGRGFGIVMPHFYKNWSNEDLRRFILNGIIWTAKIDVPTEGVKTTLPKLETFQPESVEVVAPTPKKTKN
jgi:type 1 glutamine amidotransferase